MGTVETSSGRSLRLRDVVARIADFDDELTIYAMPDWSADSNVVVEREPESGGIPEAAASLGMQYFLEISVAREVLEDLAELDLEAKTARLIQYAVNDA